MSHGEQEGLIERDSRGDASQSINKLNAYLATLKKHDIPVILNTQDRPNKKQIALEAGFSRSCWGSNPELEPLLKRYEDKWRSEEVNWLPPLLSSPSTETNNALKSDSTEYNQSANKQLVETTRLRQLERLVTEQATEIESLKKSIDKYKYLKELREVIAEQGEQPW
ncbi:hypothetical protein C9J48_11000 [Photobacterium profundum]|uniref:Uncharacterized protein n=1 Tax=Photobacterium profundum 3TCK TaxID=314280 RepID=Q1YWW4_9GAMM|nr:hypothetical protein [Photobacterium profundum]EAS40738.1 hypothetical protein P3TCK_08628 [Photobacterium profundum 3TCK]PSV62481.1 hypothetical protein C9J48_11000 [Photobacterium profundum]